MSLDIDTTYKTTVFLHYLGRANKKLEDRALAKEKVKIALSKLRKISTKKVQKDLNVLEKRIAEALEKEQKIIAKQEQEEKEQSELLEKIDKLHDKLSRYLETSEARKKRIKKLENKIFEVTNPKRYKIMQLKEILFDLEKEYKDEKKSKNYSSKELSEVARKIDFLKQKIKRLEANHQ
ncbi:hypothetical protein ACFLZN_01280 [Nanoarchaeota archaeon]